MQQVTFPHRGNWNIIEASIEFCDALSFTHYKWDLSESELTAQVRVSPEPAVESQIPVLSSSDRAGDLLPDTKEKRGDPYDLKQYHPSDGVRKILWKIFAKSGELIARHPESSMTPEGQVVIFCIADKNEDTICGATLAYLSVLEDLGLEVFFGCEGSLEEPLVTNSEEARELFIETTWNTENSTPESIAEDAKALQRKFLAQHREAALHRLVIFVSDERLSTSVGFEAALQIGSYLESCHSKPVFCVIRNSLEYFQEGFDYSKTPKVGGFSFLRYFIRPKEKFTTDADPRRLNHFLSLCAQHDWKVIL